MITEVYHILYQEEIEIQVTQDSWSFLYNLVSDKPWKLLESFSDPICEGMWKMMTFKLKVFAMSSVQQCPGRFSGIVLISKSNRLHINIFRILLINLRYNIPWIPPNWWAPLLKSRWTSTGYFSNSTGSSVTSVGSPVLWCSEADVFISLPGIRCVWVRLLWMLSSPDTEHGWHGDVIIFSKVSAGRGELNKLTPS
jgi:hypothetical protein